MSAPITTHRFTVDQFQRMAQAGVFHDDDRVELIDGQVVEMTPIGPRHQSCVDRLNQAFAQRAGDRAVVRVHGPIIVGPYGQPQPDLALLRPPITRYRAAHPTVDDVLLVIEVAETSAAYDRETKIPQYARAGVPEVWLANIPEARVEVYRQPETRAYRDVSVASSAEVIAPLALPHLALRVGDFLG